MSRCSQCVSELPAGAKFCGRCGAKVGPMPHFCAHCGRALEEGKRFCGGCGTAIGTPAGAATGVVFPPAAAASSTPARKGGGTGWKVLILLVFMLLLAGGAAGGVWYWKPWRLIWPEEKNAIDKAAWDRDLTPAPDKDAAGRKERWTAEVNQRAQEVEAAFNAKNVEAIVQLLPPPKRDELRPLLEAKRADLDRFGKVLATRKLVAVNEFIADYQVKDGKKTSPVTFALYDGKWYLYEF